MKHLNMPTLLLVLVALAVGCAREKEYEKVYKESVFAKSAISTDPNDPYVYVPTVGNTPKDVTASRPFGLGDQKLVTFKFEEDKLLVEELPREDRFSGNRNNFSPVMEFSIEHKDYRCKEDQYGDCGNTEEEIGDKPWQQKRFVKVDFASVNILETNTLPEQLTNAFEGCYGDGKTVVKDAKVEGDAVNVHVQKTWTASIECADLQTFADLRNMVFTVDYFYSFVKLSKLASPGYKAFKYPFEDQNTFGYFTSEVTKLTADNRTTVNSKTTYLNRFNPEKKEVTYYLNDAFYKEGMESVLASTEQAIVTINNSFASAGVDFKIKLEDGRGKSIGDLRNNFIVLVEDPQASGVIGYGPSVANPRTGEILKAQTIMFYGTIRKFIQDTYDELLEENAREAQRLVNSTLAANVLPQITPGQPVDEASAQRISSHRHVLNELSNHGHQTSAVQPRRSGARMSRNQLQGLDLSREMFNPSRRVERSFWQEQIRNRANLSEFEVAKAHANLMSHDCFYHSSMVNWHDTLAGGITAEALEIAELKPWNDLSEEDKEKVINKLMPNVWVPTLVHEFGHNLGLRHNFNGSEDKDNYYGPAELRALGMERDVTYSSVMDYSASSLNQLKVLGKYDKAALKFAYNRQIELKDGSIYTMAEEETLEDIKKRNEAIEEGRSTGTAISMREFQFCTDEHVEVNPGCNRFDDGAGLKAIAEHFVKTYKDNYKNRNHRNMRANFNTYDGDVNYYFAQEYTFESLRRFFELYDRLNVRYPGVMDINWDEEIANAPNEQVRRNMIANKEFFDGIKGAAQVAADFYLEVLTTPDVHCVVAQESTGRLVGIVPLAQIGGGEASSCASPGLRLNSGFKAVGQTGKFINSQRFEETLPGELNADPSQISVRGIWADKILAVDWLTKRVLGISTFDGERGNFLDYPQFAQKIVQTLIGFVTDSLEVKAKFAMANGTEIEVPYVFSITDTHQIKRSFHSGLNRFLGLNRVETDFRAVMIPMVKQRLASADDVMSNWGLYHSLSVVRLEATTTYAPDRIKKIAEFKDAQGRLLARFGAGDEHVLARELMRMREVRQSLEAFDEMAIQQILRMRTQNQIPEEIPAEMQPLFDMPIENLQAYLSGELPEDDNLMKMFLIMQ